MTVWLGEEDSLQFHLASTIMPGSVLALENTNTIKTRSLPSRSSQIGKGEKVCQSVHFGTNRNLIFLVETP